MTWRNGHRYVHPAAHGTADASAPPCTADGRPITVEMLRHALTTDKPKGSYIVSRPTMEWVEERIGRRPRYLADLAEAMDVVP